MSDKNKELTLKPIGQDRFEIQVKGAFGLAKLADSGEWEISPNMKSREEVVRKMIREFLAKEEVND